MNLVTPSRLLRQLLGKQLHQLLDVGFGQLPALKKLVTQGTHSTNYISHNLRYIKLLLLVVIAGVIQDISYGHRWRPLWSTLAKRLSFNVFLNN